jgi:hypothetical protein
MSTCPRTPLTLLLELYCQNVHRRHAPPNVDGRQQ